MPRPFVGRVRELAALRRRLDLVASDGSGVALAVRGRRQVGKSRLVEQFCQEAGKPYLYFQASRGVSPAESLGDFLEVLMDSSIPGGREVPATTPADWLAALKLLALVLPADAPSIVVIDELPWLTQQDPRLEGQLQTAWDRHLSDKPVMLILIGSDLHMMETFTGYGRPFYGRADETVIRPLNPAEVAAMTGLTGSDALDAHLITGGFPGLCRIWPAGATALEFFSDQCNDPGSPLFTMGELMLNSEFPAPDQTRRVLAAIGHGERTFSNIASSAGAGPGDPVKSGTLGPILQRLQAKHAVSADSPLATTPGNGGKLYRIDDTYLRLHLAFLAQAQEDVKRDRPDLALDRISRQWESWRGRAIKPTIREALSRAAAAGELPWPEAQAVGGWWPRNFNPEVDLVGADRAPVAHKIYYTGSIKWLGSNFDRHDWHEVIRHSSRVPGAIENETGTVVVSRSGVDADIAATVVWSPQEVLAAWS